MQATLRAAVKDDVIPLGVPFTDVNGVSHNSITYAASFCLFLCWILTDISTTLGFERVKLCLYPLYHLIGINIIGVRIVESSSQSFLFSPLHVVSLLTRSCSPERWGNLPEAVGEIPGVWGNMMTFLGGSRASFWFTIVSFC